MGFLPRTAAARRAALDEPADDRGDPGRIRSAAAADRHRSRCAFDVLGDRPACVARSLTKPHERYQRGIAVDAGRRARGRGGGPWGGHDLVIGGATVGRPDPSDEAEADARLLLAGRQHRPEPSRPPRRAARAVPTCQAYDDGAAAATRVTEPRSWIACSARLAIATSTARSSTGWRGRSCRSRGMSTTPSSASNGACTRRSAPFAVRGHQIGWRRSAQPGPGDLARPGIPTACAEVMRSHASTAERVPHLERFYAPIWELRGRPAANAARRRLWLGPLALPWMGLGARSRVSRLRHRSPRARRWWAHSWTLVGQPHELRMRATSSLHARRRTGRRGAVPEARPDCSTARIRRQPRASCVPSTPGTRW